LGNLAQRLTNPTSQVDTVAALVASVLLDEAAQTEGTVTSVALTMPAEFSVAGSPVTTAGTLAVSKATQTANKVFASPAMGSAAAPTFRALVAADLPPVLVPTVIYSVAGTPLPAASDALKGATAVVSDATTPTYLGAYVGGGAVFARVLCTGLSGGWVTG
jgi:hypothetical protein